MSDQYTFVVPPEEAGERLDRYLSQLFPDFTRSFLQKLIEEGNVEIGERAVPKNTKIRVGDTVMVTVPEPTALVVEAQNLPLDIIYEDAELLVVNKPKGMVVHPAAGHTDGTLVNALLYHCEGSLSGINGVIRPGIVHRIDKDTSGLLIVAKTDRAHQGLAEQIKVHSFLREYEAIVYGNIKEDELTIDQPIGRSRLDRKKMCVTQDNSRSAVTHCRVLERFGDFTYVRCRLETGRTHQIRVHMAYIGHPVAGDPVYGPKKVISELNGQCLHAKSIGFVHPITEKCLSFTSNLPPYFLRFLEKLNGRKR